MGKFIKTNIDEYINENKNNKIKFSDEEYDHIYKKLEFRFKNSDDQLVAKIKNKENLTNEDLDKLLKKFEYTFRKSDPEIIKKIKKHLGIEDMSNIKYSNITAKRKRDINDDILSELK